MCYAKHKKSLHFTSRRGLRARRIGDDVALRHELEQLRGDLRQHRLGQRRGLLHELAHAGNSKSSSWDAGATRADCDLRNELHYVANCFRSSSRQQAAVAVKCLHTWITTTNDDDIKMKKGNDDNGLLKVIPMTIDDGHNDHDKSDDANIILLEKSADPTPTMIMEIGWWDARMMASIVWFKSLISPSVMMSSTRYFCCCWLSEPSNSSRQYHNQ